MAASHLFRLGSISGKNGVLEALKHNKRELQRERGEAAHIDVTRTPLNYCLTGDTTPQTIATHAKVQMVKAGIDKPRKNGIMAVEVLFSLPIVRHNQDTKPFFTDCYRWVKQTFTGELLSFDVHLDESAPHTHALILPLINGKMQGDRLKGNRANINNLNDSFHAKVACRYGLSKANYKRLSANDKQSIEQQISARLKGDSVLKSNVWPCVRDAIHKDPVPFAQALGINAPASRKAKNKSFVQIITSKGTGENINPIGNYP